MDNGHIKSSRILFQAGGVGVGGGRRWIPPLIELIKFHRCLPETISALGFSEQWTEGDGEQCLPAASPAQANAPTLSERVSSFSLLSFFFSSEAKLQSDITDTWHSSYLDNRGRASLLRLHFPKARKIKARVEKRSLWDGFFK